MKPYLTACVAAVAISAAGAQDARPVPVGQWIWTHADAAIFEKSRASVPGLAVGVWTGTLRFAGEAVTVTPAMTPSVVENAEPAIVIGFDDSFDGIWSKLDDARAADAVGRALEGMIARAEAAGKPVREVQLDYACPAYALSRWGTLIGALSAGPLAGREIWITSRVSDLRREDFGEMLRAKVRGHTIQLYDTGEEDDIEPPELAKLLEAAGMPFRIGVAAYERRVPNVVETHHARWFKGARHVEKSALYRGLWVFPADREWLALWKDSR